jgi:uracil-DNA glycosylase family 4
MKENPNCQLCLLHETCNPRSVCLKGEGGDKPKLLIYNNAPTTVEDKRHRAFVSEGSDLLRWLIRRMSVNYKDVYFDYVLKCYPKANKRFGKKPDRLEMIQACFKYRLATFASFKAESRCSYGSYSL